MYPKIYLAIDNCFAYKRWTSPKQWAKVIADLGVFYIEASADNELDPLYMGKEYLKKWIDKVKQAEGDFKVKVANLYSGHGTYSTLGLTHTDEIVRRHIIENWFKPLINTAKAVDAGVGFFAHGFNENIMQNKEKFKQYEKVLIAGLCEINSYAKEIQCKKIGIEQMYVPFHLPWTIKGTADLMREVLNKSGRDFYFTEDVGHHHTKFTMPSKHSIKKAFEENDQTIWLGSNEAYAIYDNAKKTNVLSEANLNVIDKIMNENKRFFSEKEDADCYEWLKKLGKYSPIIHIQQTDGLSSAHKSFSVKNNSDGKINGRDILAALKESYDGAKDETMPKPCEEIYLTLELFSGTSQTSRSILKEYSETVEYWRKFIYKDGMTLDELL